MKSKTFFAVVGKLSFSTALHIGVGRGDVGTDAPLRRNDRGELFLPGTALAGALRTLATRLATQINFTNNQRQVCLALSGHRQKQEVCGCPVCHLFGEIYPGEGEDEARDGRASRLWVYDAPLVKAPLPFIRDGVGIDRSIGAASRAGRVKFDHEILPAGAEFDLRLELEDAEPDDQVLLVAVLAEWMAGRAWLGGGSSRGLGNACLGDVHCYQNNLKDASSLLQFLKASDAISTSDEDLDWFPGYISQSRLQSQAGDAPFIEVSFALAFDGLFLTQDATAAYMLGFDHVSLMDGTPGDDQHLRPVLTGSGLRGVIRSHAERIARTLATYEAAREPNSFQAFSQSCPACNPLQDQPELPLAKCAEINGLARYAEPGDDDLCLACRLFGSTQMGSRLRVLDAPLVSEPVWKAVDFLAIDRFTGGGVDGAKFDAAALWKPVFQVRIFLEQPRGWELGWLALVLRDLAEGKLSFGFGSAKGFGHAVAKDINLRCGFVHDQEWSKQALLNEIKDAPGFYRLAQFTAADWVRGVPFVKGWVKEFLQEVDDFDRKKGALSPLVKDTYFKDENPEIDRNLEKLYPLHHQEGYHG